MKNKNLFLLFILIFSSGRIFSQTHSEWQPIYLAVSGANSMDGVEASFQLNTCNGEDVVYVKFINHTAVDLKIEWFDEVFTQELKWIKKEQLADKKSLTLPANKEAKGECTNLSSEVLAKTDNHYTELIVKLKNFALDKKDFKRYSSSHLKVTAVQ